MTKKKTANNDIENKRSYLMECIHSDTHYLEDLSDLELCTMDDYDELVEVAENNIFNNFDEEEIDYWCKDFGYDPDKVYKI